MDLIDYRLVLIAADTRIMAVSKSCSAVSFTTSLRNSPVARMSAIMPFRRVQNTAARLILDLPMTEHVTPAQRQIRWLPVDRRVDFKLCTMLHSIGQCRTYSSCRHRQPDEVRFAIRRHPLIH